MLETRQNDHRPFQIYQGNSTERIVIHRNGLQKLLLRNSRILYC